MRTIIKNSSSIFLVVIFIYSIFISYRYIDARQAFSELVIENQENLDENLRLNDQIHQLRTKYHQCKFEQARDSMSNNDGNN